jgi:4'-phosphopantetheinyl transferase
MSLDPARAREIISSGGVLVCHVSGREIDDPGLLAAGIPNLSAEERERYERFAFSRSKGEFLAGRALARTVLAGLLKAAPESIEFRISLSGKPSLAPGAGGGIEFNLSHTRSLVAAVFCSDCAVGIDAQAMDPRTATAAIAGRFFSESEKRHLLGFSGEAFSREFFKVWTLKEAWLKVRGSGISIPLGSFSITPPSDSGSGIDIEIAEELGERADEWQFDLTAPTAEHLIATAVHRGRGADRPLHVWSVGAADLLNALGR